jgi:hypothetical protein
VRKFAPEDRRCSNLTAKKQVLTAFVVRAEMAVDDWFTMANTFEMNRARGVDTRTARAANVGRLASDHVP